MKKQYLLALACSISAAAFAQSDDYVKPVEIEYMAAQHVSPNGLHIAGQDVLGSMVYYYDVKNGGLPREYTGASTGIGNCVADNGMIVGQYFGNAEQAALFYNGQYKTLYTSQSALNGITPDGTRACGYRTNNGAVPYVPMVVEIKADGSFGTVTNLPYPKNDLFGDIPQFVTAVSISDDGMTIVGMVQDGLGFYQWPIIYTQDPETGKWSYSQPTEQFFNPDNLTVPKYPEEIVWGENGAPVYPRPEDFLTPEEYALWQKYIEEYGDLYKDEAYMFLSPEGEAAYKAASAKFDKEANEYLANIFDKYYLEMQAVGFNEQWLDNLYSLSPDGKTMVAIQAKTEADVPTNIYLNYTPYVFKTEDNSYSTLPTSYGEGEFLIPTSILYDGTMMFVSSADSFVPWVASMVLPGKSEFTPFMEFLGDYIPSYLPWLEDSQLTEYGVIGYDENDQPIYGDYTITGRVGISKDYKTIFGGVPVGDGLSYVYYTPDGINVDVSGVNEIPLDPTQEDAVYNVYNLSGLKVMTTDDASRVQNLPKGIYIVNGKKVLVK